MNRRFFISKTFVFIFFSLISTSNAQTWDLSIKGYLSGFKVGVASGKFSIDKNKISLEIRAETSGITSIFFPWEQNIKAISNINKKSIISNFYRVDEIRDKTKKGHMELNFYDRIALVKSAEPPVINDTRREPVDEKLRINVLDPATAIIAIGYLTSIYKNCDHKIPIFDGRRRFDLYTKEIGIENLTSSAFTDSHGESLKCKISIEKIAGYSEKELKKHPRSGFVWLQKLPESEFMMFPVKVQLPIGRASFMTHLSVVFNKQ